MQAEILHGHKPVNFQGPRPPAQTIDMLYEQACIGIMVPTKVAFAPLWWDLP